MAAEDPDYHRRDLSEAIQKNDYPVWRLEMQIMPFEDAATYRFNPFDLTISSSGRTVCVQREGEPEARTLAGHTVQANATAMLLNDSFADV